MEIHLDLEQIKLLELLQISQSNFYMMKIFLKSVFKTLHYCFKVTEVKGKNICTWMYSYILMIWEEYTPLFFYTCCFREKYEVDTDISKAVWCKLDKTNQHEWIVVLKD